MKPETVPVPMEHLHDARAYVDGYSIGWDDGYLAAEAAEEESLRRHRTELDRVRRELWRACMDWHDNASTLTGASGDCLRDAALRLHAITASRAPLPGEGL